MLTIGISLYKLFVKLITICIRRKSSSLIGSNGKRSKSHHIFGRKFVKPEQEFIIGIANRLIYVEPKLIYTLSNIMLHRFPVISVTPRIHHCFPVNTFS